MWKDCTSVRKGLRLLSGPTPTGSKGRTWNSSRFTAFVFQAEPAPASFCSRAGVLSLHPLPHSWPQTMP